MRSKKSKPTKARSVETRNRTKTSKALWGFLIAIATLLGGFVALLALTPRLSVSKQDAIDPNDPFSTPFHVVNDGYLPLFSVRFYMIDIDMEGADGRKGKISGEAYATNWQLARFSAGQPIDLYAGRVIKSSALTSVKLTIIVQYRPLPLIPYNRKWSSRFVTYLGPDNHLHWEQWPGD